MRVGEHSAPSMQILQSPMLSGINDDSTALPVSQFPIRGGAEGKSESTMPLIEYRTQSSNPIANDVKDGVFVSSPDRNLKGGDSVNNKESRSLKIVIKIRPKTSTVAAAAKEIQLEEEGKIEDNEIQEEGNQQLLAKFDDDDDDSLAKLNRPRKPIKKLPNLNGSGLKNSGSGSTMQQQHQEKRAKSPLVNPNTSHRSETQEEEGKRKIEFKFTLSREEIEEDMLSIIGSNPPRRPKKRSKTVNKKPDRLLPGGTRLQFLTGDYYKVDEHTKG